MLGINTNLTAQSLRRYSAGAEAGVQKAVSHLSSGLRIERAQDDAAGLAVAQRLDSGVRGNTIALRNANEATAFSQVAAQALGQVSDALRRMREIAVQAANAGYSENDRKGLNAEYSQLQAQVRQITSGTRFNGLSVFDGSEHRFQVGADATAASSLVFKGTDLISDDSDLGRTVFPNNGVTLAAVNKAKAAYIADGGGFDTLSGTAGGEVGSLMASYRDNISAADQAIYDDALNVFLGANGRFSAVDGSPVSPMSGSTTVVVSAGPPPVTQQVPAATSADLAVLSVFSNASLNYYAAGKGTQVLDAESASVAIASIDNALDQVSQESAHFGAFSNQLDDLISQLQIATDNQSQALGRIVDTDYARESARLVRSQMLQAAGTALMSQARQEPDVALMLLRNNL